MKKIVFLLLLIAASVFAAPVGTINPADLGVTPGQSTSWSFTIQADPLNWITTTGSFILSETDPLFGVYEDVIGMMGGPSNAVLAPGAPDWLGTLANYHVSVNPGPGNSGVIRVLYEAYSGDPNACSNCYVGSGEIDVPFSATVVPEPGTWLLLTAGLAMILWRRRILLRGQF